MDVTVDEVPKILKILDGLVGQKAWNTRVGVGSFVTCEFGSALPPPPEGHIHGEWHLWVQNTAWRVERLNQVLAGSSDERDKMQDAVSQIDGLRLEHLEIFPYTADALFRFEQAVTLRLFVCNLHGDYIQWGIFTPSGKVVSIGPGISWSYDY